MSRQRLTWKNEEAKTASPPPQVPSIDRTEKSDHPAAQPDPDYAKYQQGDPSAWAEDVHPGPYDTSPAPATPGYSEPADHPAAKPGKPMSASDMRKATERKAAKCIRIAQSMMGEDATVAAVEDQALDFMDLPDQQIEATLGRLGLTAEDDDDSDDDDDDAGADKEASVDVTARLEKIEASLGQIMKAMNLFSQDPDMDYEEDFMVDEMDEDDDDDDAEDMLEEMLADSRGRAQNDPESGYEGMDDGDTSDDDAEALLSAMMEEEGMGVYAKKSEDDEDSDDEGDDDAEGKEAAKADEEEDTDDDEDADKEASEVELVASDADPMGLVEPAIQQNDELSSLYGEPHFAAKADDDDGDDDGDDDSGDDGDDSDDNGDDDGEVEAKKKASKKAATKLRPQPKKASKGAKRVGTITKAAAASEVNELSNLWDHAPDVSSVFGS